MSKAVQCPCCIGTGLVACTDCSGWRADACMRCGGSNTLPCAHCGGARSVAGTAQPAALHGRAGTFLERHRGGALAAGTLFALSAAVLLLGAHLHL